MRLTNTIILLLTVSIFAHAQGDIDYDKMEDAVKWYADHAEGIMIRFEGLRHDAGQLPQKFFSLAVSTWDERLVILFSPNGNDLKARTIDRSTIQPDVSWESISYLGLRRTHATDITLKERPLPVRNMDKAKNTFEVVADTKENLPAGNYNQMIFKPHQNGVRLATKHQDVKKDENGTVVRDETQYVFKLKDPAIVSKMFRGYKDEEAVPWVVKNSFFDDHIPLQFSRWKEGEPVKKASSYEKQIISSYYGGRPIKDSRWLATLESGERTFYAVQFEHQGDDALAALVCIAEGAVVSTWEFHGKPDPYGSIWFVDDDGDFMEHAPEIHCMVATNEGLELYIRQFGGESVSYYILREMGTVWMEIQDDCWVYVWD